MPREISHPAVDSNKGFQVTIVIPNYNGGQHLKRLFASVANQTFPDYEVIIVDDCSPDRPVLDTIRSLIKDHDNMRLVENAENLGFVKTCNRGIELARSEYICILTNDTEVQPNFMADCVAALDRNRSVAVLSCIISDKNGNNWFSGGSYKAGVPVKLRDDFQGVRSVDWVAGTAPFYRREVFEKIGLLDERYFMYHEDVEFSLRVRYETDYKVCMLGEKLVTHYDGSSLPRGEAYYYISRNLFLILRKYFRNHAYYIYLMNILLLHIPRTIVISLIVSVPKRSLKALSLSLRSFHMIGGALDGLVNG